MTDDKRKKLESCFDSLEKIVRFRDTLTSAVSNVSTNLEGAIGRLETKRIIARTNLIVENIEWNHVPVKTNHKDEMV